MNEKIKKLRDQILIDNELYELVPRNDDDSYDDTILGDDGKYHKRVPLNLSESNLNNFISYKMLECTKSMDAKMKTVKGIMVFWVTLTIVQLILGFVIYLLIKNAFPF